jgi:3-hydroxymyristoyl/3-hydroxydecanoyl-(acyl carrier protein) dehydratase
VSATDRVVVERTFRLDHPASRGHFPGNPIIPGAVLLNETIAAIRPDSVAPVHILSAKFLHPARPGDRVTIEFAPTDSGIIRFACTVEGRAVLTGQMSCAPPTAA